MVQLARILLCVLLFGAGARRTKAFSLSGPLEAWQTVTLGYGLAAGEVAGPMNLGEEYRWNSPVIVFAFDPSFLGYFGQKGAEAVEGAMKILNDVPPVSSLSTNLSEYPMDTRRWNYQALALRVRDMKSWTLSLMLEALGLSPPERWIYTLRSQAPTGIPGLFFYTTIRRNFDPVTWQDSSYINGVLYTYSVQLTALTPTWEAVEITVDPLAPSVTTVAALAGIQGGTTDFRGSGVLFNPGLFYTGLTRDDVGGLRYLLNKNNFNVETLPTNSVAPFSTGAGGGTGSSRLPWLPVTIGGGGGGAAGGGAGGLGGGLAAGGTNTLVDGALRGGVEKLQFVRADFDSLLGVFFTNTVTFTDNFMTNGAVRQQLVQRVMTTPDILFAAADLGVDAQGVPILVDRDMSFQNNNTLNSTGPNAIAGPGVVSSPVVITFSKVGPFFRHRGETSEETARATVQGIGLVWGSYDGSTNAPILFPSGISIRDLEQIVLRESGGQPWRVQQ